ncbi:hypothetical protein ElyMa_001675000 [Elysia marginata]|uniref:Uncharacterized protein n=1 Tax=Elysia marginata TaxID=1093978 RepID=A0AAV4JU92_9GAST|nr:hypothetical protein ElyMa_001675000 [Elysia marginata]
MRPSHPCVQPSLQCEQSDQILDLRRNPWPMPHSDNNGDIFDTHCSQGVLICTTPGIAGHLHLLGGHADQLISRLTDQTTRSIPPIFLFFSGPSPKGLGCPARRLSPLPSLVFAVKIHKLMRR